MLNRRGFLSERSPRRPAEGGLNHLEGAEAPPPHEPIQPHCLRPGNTSPWQQTSAGMERAGQAIKEWE